MRWVASPDDGLVMAPLQPPAGPPDRFGPARPAWSRNARRHQGTVSIALLLVGAVTASALVHHLALPDLSRMPVAPWWVSLFGAAFASTGMLARRSHPRVSIGLLWLAGAALAATALPRMPHDLLAVLSTLVSLVTGGEPVFPHQVPWLSLAAHLVSLAAAGALIVLAARIRRAAQGHCPSCGARPERSAQRCGRRLRVAAGMAAAAPVPYAALKLAWGLGWRGGLTDPHLFDAVTLATPGFGDTVGFAVIGVALAMGMAVPRHSRVVRFGLLTGGILGSIMLLPVGLLGTAKLITAVLGLGQTVEDGGLAVWVFALVYPSFLLWGGALAATTYLYARAVRLPCRSHPSVGCSYPQDG
jgi:hypothetical protein